MSLAWMLRLGLVIGTLLADILGFFSAEDWGKPGGLLDVDETDFFSRGESSSLNKRDLEGLSDFLWLLMEAA